MKKYDNIKTEEIDNVFDEQLLEDAFEFYADVNGLLNRESIKKQFFQFNETPKGDVCVKEIFVGKKKPRKKNQIRVALTNEIIESKNYTQGIKGVSINSQRQQTLDKIKDTMTNVPDLEMYAMAELSLPESSIYEFCRHTAKQQISLITGIEFIRVGDLVFNFILTVLPVKVDGINDSVPIFRLKNDYTHGESQLINGVEGGLKVPEFSKYYYHLYRWRGLSFGTYYCFELANITMRSIFFSLVDFLVVPIWNRDNKYFNAIAEAVSRDLHCYYIQVNTSNYGESRIIEPVKSERSDLARVKGGTIYDQLFRVSFMVSDLKIHQLRDAQLLTYPLNKNKKHNPNEFKPLPPNWPYENVKKRRAHKSLL